MDLDNYQYEDAFPEGNREEDEKPPGAPKVKLMVPVKKAKTEADTTHDQGGKRMNELYQQINNAQTTLKMISERLMQSQDSYEESQALAGVQLQLSAIADKLEEEIHRVEKGSNSG